MTCDELAVLLPDLLDDTLTSPVLEKARAALKECPQCQRELEIVSQVRSLLAQFRSNDHEPPETSREFITKLLANIRCGKQNPILLEPNKLCSLEEIEQWLRDL